MADDPAPAAAPGRPTVDLNTCAALLLMTPQRVSQLVKENVIPRAARGRYDLQGAVQGYIRWLKDEERRTSKSAAASRLTDQRALEVEERRQQRNRTLIEFDEAKGVLDDVVGIYRAAYAGLPAAVTMDLAIREDIEGQVSATQARVEATLRKRLGALRSGGDPVPGTPEDDA